jgi:hypothetical protein
LIGCWARGCWFIHPDQYLKALPKNEIRKTPSYAGFADISKPRKITLLLLVIRKVRVTGNSGGKEMMELHGQSPWYLHKTPAYACGR